MQTKVWSKVVITSMVLTPSWEAKPW